MALVEANWQAVVLDHGGAGRFLWRACILAGRGEEAEAIAKAVPWGIYCGRGRIQQVENTHISWKRMLARSNALETSDRSMAASMASRVVS